MTLSIRIADPEDAPHLYQLHTAAIRTVCARHYSPEIIDGWLLGRSPAGYLPPIARRAIFVAELDHKIVGFGEAAPGAVIAVYVDPAVVGKGIGHFLLMHGIKVARHGHSGPIRVESTLNAGPFYARHGFMEIERSTVRRNHVDVPIIVMEYRAAANLTVNRTRRFITSFWRASARRAVTFNVRPLGPWLRCLQSILRSV